MDLAGQGHNNGLHEFRMQFIEISIYVPRKVILQLIALLGDMASSKWSNLDLEPGILKYIPEKTSRYKRC